MNRSSSNTHITGVITLFLLIVLWNINRESFWGDEAFSVYSIMGGGHSTSLNTWDFRSFWHNPKWQSPFFYNLLLKIYSHIFGTFDFTLRFFSTLWILFGAITSYILLYKHHLEKLALIYFVLFLFSSKYYLLRTRIPKLRYAPCISKYFLHPFVLRFWIYVLQINTQTPYVLFCRYIDMRGCNGSNALLRIYFCVFYGYDCTYSGLAHEAIFHTPIYHFYPYGCDGGYVDWHSSLLWRLFTSYE